MYLGTSLAVQWLRFCAPTAGGAGLITGEGTKIPHAAWHSQKKEKEKKEIHLNSPMDPTGLKWKEK